MGHAVDDDRPVHTDDAGLDLRATDIDRQDVSTNGIVEPHPISPHGP